MNKSFALLIIFNLCISGISVGQKIYWTERSGSIVRANLDGTNIEEIVTGQGPGDVQYLGVDEIGKKIYWSGDGIKKAELNGTNIEIAIAKPSSGIYRKRDIIIDPANQKIYWTVFDHPYGILRANLDGTNEERIINLDDIGDYLIFSADSQQIYWSEGGGRPGRIQKANLDGTNVTELIPESIALVPEGLAIDADSGYIYWAQKAGNRIMRANLADGSNYEILIQFNSSHSPSGLVIDTSSNKLYWTWEDSSPNSTNGGIECANLDGSNIQSLVQRNGLFPQDLHIVENHFSTHITQEKLPIELFQAFPNPMVKTTTIMYQLTASSKISMKIYNNNGEVIENLIDEFQIPGTYEVEWSIPGEISAGVYSCVLKIGSMSATKNILVLRK